MIALCRLQIDDLDTVHAESVDIVYSLMCIDQSPYRELLKICRQSGSFSAQARGLRTSATPGPAGRLAGATGLVRP
jgi:hypothetical protein